MDSSSLDLVFPMVCGKEIIVRSDGGYLTSDAGLLFVREADRKLGFTTALSSAVWDRRQQCEG